MESLALRGRTALVTGATSGIGEAAALALSRLGASVSILARDQAKADASAQRIARATGETPDILIADYSNLKSIRAAAGDYLKSERPLDILLNNAGLVNTQRLETVDGYEQTFQVNHLAPFLLTGLLMPRILESADGRVVNVASNAHSFYKGIRFEDPHWREAKFKTFQVYGHAKLANILFTNELARRFSGGTFRSNSLHPGAVATGMGTNNPGLAAKFLPSLLKPFFRTPEKGAETAVYLCTENESQLPGGHYYYDCRPIAPKPWAQDRQAAERLWQLSEQLTDCRYG